MENTYWIEKKIKEQEKMNEKLDTIISLLELIVNGKKTIKSTNKEK